MKLPRSTPTSLVRARHGVHWAARLTLSMLSPEEPPNSPRNELDAWQLRWLLWDGDGVAAIPGDPSHPRYDSCGPPLALVPFVMWILAAFLM